MKEPAAELSPNEAAALLRTAPFAPVASWSLERVASAQPHPDRRQQFQVVGPARRMGFLTIGRDLSDLRARLELFARAYPGLGPRLLGFAHTGDRDLLLEEHIDGQPLLAAFGAHPSVALEALARLEQQFTGALRPSSHAAAAAELDVLREALLALPIWRPADRDLFRATVFPWLADRLVPEEPTVRVAHGDLLSRNILVTPKGSVRLIDCEHAAETHFHAEEWLRFGYWDELPPEVRAFTDQRISNRPALGLYLALRQLVLEHPRHSPRRYKIDAERWCAQILHLLRAEGVAGLPSQLGPRAADTVGVQLFWADEAGWRESSSRSADVPGDTHELAFDVPPATRLSALRLDPLDLPGSATIRAVMVVDTRTNQPVYSATGAALGALTPAGDASVERCDESGLHLRSNGPDPQLYLPQFPFPSDAQLRVTVSIAITLDQVAPHPHLMGNVEQITGQAITGWVHDQSQPTIPAQVRIYLDERLVATIAGDGFRADLRTAGLDDGRKAFFFNPSPLLGVAPAAVRVAFATNDATMPNGMGRIDPTAPGVGADWDAPVRARLAAAPTDAEVLAAHPESTWPLISVIVPVFNPPPPVLARAIESVRAQIYPRWELVVVDDASTDRAISGFLGTLSATDSRIRVRLESTNRGISAATNLGAAEATGSFVAFLDHDDELAPDALAAVAAALLGTPGTDIIYTDQDKIDEQGQRFQPFHKPAWSPVYFLGAMYVGHLLVTRRTLFQQVGGCDPRFDRVQDFELMLRLSEHTTRIQHVPKILYHWRVSSGSIAQSSHAKGPIDELQARAVQAHLDRRGIAARAVPHPRIPHRIQLFPSRAADDRLVSIIIPSKDAPEHIRRCLESIYRLTTHRRFEVIVADTGTTDPAALAALAAHPIRRIDCPGPFNFSRANNQAAAVAQGDILLFLNNDTEVLTADWLQILLTHLDLPGVGAVAPLLLYPDGTVQHAGVALGLRGTCDHVWRHADPSGDGYAGNLPCAHEVSSLTAACLMVRREHFKLLGGFEEGYAHIYQDADLCLRLRERGLANLYVGNVVLRHHENASRGRDYDFVDRAVFLDRWERVLAEGDPYYNPNFALNRGDFVPR